MKRHKKKYDNYVDHPRYGRHPLQTGLNPQKDFARGVHLHWHTSEDCLVPNTAVKANTGQQVDAVFPVTHYFDVKRQCKDCGRMFLFFAREQKYWYESLRFTLNADCIRCVDCRKQEQFSASRRSQYETLLKNENRSDTDTLVLVACCLTLIERSEFGIRSLETARQLLNSVPKQSPLRQHASYRDLTIRADRLLLETRDNSID